MNLLEGMKKNNTVTNTRGSNYYLTTYDSNLDVLISRTVNPFIKIDSKDV